ncbi:MAG: SpoIIE family protein phosphatase [Pirellulaceae bacterium]
MAFLKANNGPEAGRHYDLTADEYILGRHPDCTIVIDVGAVSRRHCRIYHEASQYLVEDLRSRNGTFLNDGLVENPHSLRHGDRIRICDVVFSYLEQGEDAIANIEDSSFRAVLVDDQEANTSTIMSKLDVVTGHSGTQLVATPEAKLNALIQIMQSLGKALSLDEVLPQVLESLFKIFVQADRGFIGLLDAGGTLIPRWTKLRRADSDDTIRVSRTIANSVMDTKEAILSADAASDVRFEMSQSIADFRIRSMMCAPLLDVDHTPMGILQIDTLDQRQRFQEEDLELLVSAASQASIAIVNARLHDETVANRMLERDVKLAIEVQRAFLPSRTPDIDGYEFYHYYQAANQIGGDYYDYVELPNGKLAVVVADVVGHGVAAAMLMAKLSAEARFCLASESSPAAGLTALNQRICGLSLHRFVTCVMAVLDTESHEATIVNAGHMAPLYRRANGQLEEPSREGSGPPLGIIEDLKYDQVSVTIHPQESLTMYTDGLNETMNADGECFSIARIRKHVQDSDGSPDSIGHTLLEDVLSYLGDRPQDDDMCLVSLRRL